MITSNRRQLNAACLLVSSFSSLLFTALAPGQTPEWIWHPTDGNAPASGEVRFFRRTFTVHGEVSKAVLAVAADNQATVWLNGEQAGKSDGHERAAYSDVTARIKPGENLLTIRALSLDGPAGVLANLEITSPAQRKQLVVTDGSWLASALEEEGWQSSAVKTPANWVAAKALGKVGTQPWGDVLKPAQATSAEAIKVLPGFKIELLCSAQPNEGSWICMTVDPKGRLIISPQRDDQQLLRVTLTREGQVSKIEPIPAPVKQAMGLCYSHDSLYVNGHGPSGTGLYRLIDQNRNDQFDANEVRFLKRFQGEGEHG